MAIIDISPPLSPATTVWPGDDPLERTMTASIAQGDAYTASRLSTTVHLGAHTDAPSHYGEGASVDQLDLGRYLGRCQVLGVPLQGAHRPLGAELAAQVEPGVTRVLFATASFHWDQPFSPFFASLSVALIERLSERGVVLVGIDTPSVDSFDAASLPVHHACARREVSIIEGLVLRHVQPGIYRLVALPLCLVGFDGSPLRAVLETLDPG